MALPKEVKSSVIFCLLAKVSRSQFSLKGFLGSRASPVRAHTCWQTCRRSVSTCAESVQGAVGSERLGQTGYLRSSLHSPCQSWFSMVVVTYRTFGGSPSPDVQLIDFWMFLPSMHSFCQWMKKLFLSFNNYNGWICVCILLSAGTYHNQLCLIYDCEYGISWFLPFSIKVDL